MRLDWSGLFLVIFIFALFFFDPLLRAVGTDYTVLIICVGLLGLTAVKVTENLTEHKCCEDEEEDDNA